MWESGLSQNSAVTESMAPGLVAMTARDPANAAQAMAIEDDRTDSFPILARLLRILRLTRPTAGMLRALLRLGMSKCRTQMSWAPHTSIVLTPLLRRMSVEEA